MKDIFPRKSIAESLIESETWAKHNNPRAGGMSKKSVKSYRRSHPGSKIQTAVTTKPSKLKAGSKAAKRRKSFCARMRGMKKHRTGAKTARDPNSNINKSLRRWHCESIEELQELLFLAENYIKESKKPRLPGQALGVKVMSMDEFVNQKKTDEEVDEATNLPASTRELKGQELTDYLDRIRNKDKKKTDKYNLPYIHRTSVIKYYNAEGKQYDVDAIKKALAQRPKKLLKQNEKMVHSSGEKEQFFNIGFAALVGVALDENTNELIVVNTCPGAGSCKTECFAMKGGKVQFEGPWLSDGRILTYLLNDPTGFFEQLSEEIAKEEAKGQKGEYTVTIRWHDAGDFFSPEYMRLAFNLANRFPNISFYAYTKVADAALGNKPSNFMINWSEGASISQEKQVKKNDPTLTTTKNSRIVPSSLFYDLLVKDEKKNLIKGSQGQWQVIPDQLPELKQRLAQEYGISPNSILSYNEWENKVKGNDKSPLKYNVIVAPGEPDLTANDKGVLSTLLLKH